MLSKTFHFISVGSLAFFFCFYSPAISQNNKSDVTLSAKVGSALPSTGTKQKAPRIDNVATIALDVLCIEVAACEILPSIQIPYQKDSTDILKAVHTSSLGEENAFLSVWMGNGGGYTYPDNLEFSIINEKTNEKVYTGKAVMQWRKSDAEDIGTKVNHTHADVIRFNFSNFNLPGKYRVCVDGVGCSYPFYIDSTNTWLKAFNISMKGIFNQKSGIPMLPPYTDFVRPRSFNPMDSVKAYRLAAVSGKSAYGITTSIAGRALGGWESNYSIPASPTLVRAHYLTGNAKHLRTLLRSTLFSAGANQMNLVLTTGLGENCVQHPLHISGDIWHHEKNSNYII